MLSGIQPFLIPDRFECSPQQAAFRPDGVLLFFDHTAARLLKNAQVARERPIRNTTLHLRVSGSGGRPDPFGFPGLP
jgi:hypothetical protein